jgi:hypothetical protein
VLAAAFATSGPKNWNAVVSLVILAFSLTYTGWSTYQTITGQTLAQDEGQGNVQAAKVRPCDVVTCPRCIGVGCGC